MIENKYFTAKCAIGADGIKHLCSMDIREVPENGCIDLDEIEELQDVKVIGAGFYLLHREGLRIGKLVLPRGVRKIRDNAFNGKSISEIVWPDNCDIPARAFMHSGLKRIHNIGGVKAIGKEAFRGCRLESIYIPDGVTEISECCFAKSELQEIRGGANIELIGEGAFKECTNLKSFAIPSKVREIPSECFCGCVSLANVSGIDDISSFGTGSFKNCKALKDFPTFNKARIIGACAFENTCVDRLDLSQSVCSKIGVYAFANTAVNDFKAGYFLKIKDVPLLAFEGTPFAESMPDAKYA